MHNTQLKCQLLKGELKYLQIKLKQAGFYNEPITGYFGEETLAAVLAFQKSRRIPESKILKIITNVVPEKELSDLFMNDSKSNASTSAVTEIKNKNIAGKLFAQVISLFKQLIKFL